VPFPTSGQASEAGPAVRMRTAKNRRPAGKINLFIFRPVRRFFFCPEALLATFKFQAQIVCFCAQADSPAGFFAAFFPGKKARILPLSISVCRFMA